jgi:hypothetical protein
MNNNFERFRLFSKFCFNLFSKSITQALSAFELKLLKFCSFNYLNESELNVGYNSDSSSLYPTDESTDDKSYIYLLVIFLVLYLTGIIATLSLYVLITNNFIGN